MKFLEQDQILSEQELEMENSSQKSELQDASKRRYNRISTQKRELLLEKIFFDGKKIKNAAKELKINYSSAKTILHLYRKKIKKQGKMAGSIGEDKRCSVKQIFDANKVQSNICNRGNEFTIVISQGGREQNKTVLNSNPFLQSQNSARISPTQQQQYQQQQKQQQKVNKVKKIDTQKIFEFEQEKEEVVSNSVIVTKIEENNSSSQMSNFYDQSTNNTIAQNSLPQLQKGYLSNTSQILYGTNNSQQNIIQNQQQNNKVNSNNLRNILGPNINLNYKQQQQLFQYNFGPFNQKQQNIKGQFSF